MTHLDNKQNIFLPPFSFLDANPSHQHLLSFDSLNERRGVIRPPTQYTDGAPRVVVSGHESKAEATPKSKKETENSISNNKESKRRCNNIAASTSASEASLCHSFITTIESPSSNAVRTEPEDAELFKTELCRSWEELGRCKYGLRCKFAHGCQEIRHLDRHPRYKTTPCRQFHTRGFCSYGSRCHFIHGESDRLLLAFILTAVQLEKSKQGNSKFSARSGNLKSKKSANKGHKDELASLQKSSNHKVISLGSQGVKPSSLHRIHSIKPVKSLSNSGNFNLQQDDWTGNVPHNQVTVGMSQIRNAYTNNWDLGTGPLLSLSEFQKCQNKNNLELEVNDNNCTLELWNEIKNQVQASNCFYNELHSTGLSGNLPDDGFLWPNQPRSRTSSGESFGNDFEISGFHYGDVVDDDQEKQQQERLIMQHHRQQFVLSQRHMLEERLIETLQKMNDLKFESETLSTTPSNSDTCRKPFGGCFEALANNVNYYSSPMVNMTGHNLPPDWN